MPVRTGSSDLTSNETKPKSAPTPISGLPSLSASPKWTRPARPPPALRPKRNDWSRSLSLPSSFFVPEVPSVSEPSPTLACAPTEMLSSLAEASALAVPAAASPLATMLSGSRPPDALLMSTSRLMPVTAAFCGETSTSPTVSTMAPSCRRTFAIAPLAEVPFSPDSNSPDSNSPSSSPCLALKTAPLPFTLPLRRTSPSPESSTASSPSAVVALNPVPLTAAVSGSDVTKLSTSMPMP